MDGISALMDGELGPDEARRQVAKMKDDAALRRRWDEFHLIRDAMRGESLLSPRFNDALAGRLAAEPTVLAPRRTQSSVKRITTYTLSAAASVGAAALVAWVALGPDGAIAPQEPIAKVQVPVSPIKTVVAEPAPPAPAPLASVSSEGRMNEYLLAHQGFSPSTALQGLAPYIRSVSTTRPIEGR
jgi:sigma-E factor negative regulatory protein RseA